MKYTVLRRDSGLLIYVAGPLTTDSKGNRVEDKYERDNVLTAMEVGKVILDMGHTPLIPHFSYYFEKHMRRTGRGLLPGVYLGWDLKMLARCDALFVIAKSVGTRIEISETKALGKPIFYRYSDIPTVEEVEKGWKR